MKKKLISFCVLVILLNGYLFSYTALKKQREQFIESNYIDYTIPSKFTGLMSLEFKGFASDFILFKFMTFIGGRIEDVMAQSERYWGYMVETLETVTDLDPYFWDAYLFSEMFLAWGAGRYEDANRILMKGREYLTDEYRIPYYIGFNYYYFLNDYEKGSEFLMEASQLPGCPYYIGSLAARLATYSRHHRVGIAFLKDMLDSSKDERTKKEFQMRITAMELMDGLEQKLDEFRAKAGRYPGTLQDLVNEGFIERIPEDPYGGEFIMLPNGRVYTTSNMLIKVKDDK